MAPNLVQVTRTLHHEEGDISLSVSADISDLEGDELQVALSLLALDVELSVIRNALSAGALTSELAREKMRATQNGFSASISKLLAGMAE